jgi:hypothetical protein
MGAKTSKCMQCRSVGAGGRQDEHNKPRHQNYEYISAWRADKVHVCLTSRPSSLAFVFTYI